MLTFRRRSHARHRILVAALIGAAVYGADAVKAEPAHADMMLAAHKGENLRPPGAVQTFKLAGADFSLRAIGRSAYADNESAREFIDESRDMKKVMPGYPQPAFVTFDLVMWF